MLVSHKFDMSGLSTRRLAWHPQMDNLLAVITSDRVALINIPPNSGLCAYLCMCMFESLP